MAGGRLFQTRGPATVIDCLQLSGTKTCNDGKKLNHFQKAGTLHFHFLGEYSQLDWVKTMGTRGKINTILYYEILI